MISLDAMPIHLANGKGYAWVDQGDHAILSEISWSLLKPHGASSKTFYAAGRLPGDRNKTLMHKLIGSFYGMFRVDHIDHDGLNNTRINFREANNSQQQYNRRMQSNNKSGFIGISRTDSKSSWGAFIHIGPYKSKNLGSFATKEAAARVRDEWAHHAYGEFAVLNFPRDKAA